jgi:hypothetical protein
MSQATVEATRKEELEHNLEELDGLYDELIKGASRKLGRLFSLLYDLPLIGPSLLRGIARLSSLVLVKGRVLGLRADNGGDPVRIVSGWMKFPALMRVPCEVAEAGDDRVVLLWTECPIGYCRAGQASLCRAVMEIDRMTVQRMGGEMTIEETILEGGTHCRFVFTPRRGD